MDFVRLLYKSDKSPKVSSSSYILLLAFFIFLSSKIPSSITYLYNTRQRKRKKKKKEKGREFKTKKKKEKAGQRQRCGD